MDGTLDTTSDWSDQDDLFSGKHHRPEMNVQVMGTVHERLLALGDPVHGSRHDVYAWKQCGLAEQAPDSQEPADLGYVDVDGITTGTRRPPGGQLTDRRETLDL